MHSKEIQDLIKCLSKVPGLGPRSGRRAALYLIKQKETLLAPLMTAFQGVYEGIVTCHFCGNLDTASPCSICTHPTRDPHVLCIVEDVVDLWAIERTQFFKGLYFSLGGVLSAIQGITPEELRIPFLISHIKEKNVQEVILALNATMDGQTTSFYLKDILEPLGVHLSSLAQGVPLGGELDYLDDGTLMTALQARRAF
jgi:recombination protein RecR